MYYLYIPASIICLFDLGSIKYYVYGIMKLANCDIKRNDVVFMVQVTSKTYDLGYMNISSD